GSAVGLLALAALVAEPGFTNPSPKVVAAVAYQTVIVAFASYLAWFWLLTRYPASHMAAFTFWTPIFALVFAWLLLGEPITPALVLAMGLVAVGLYLVNRVPTLQPTPV
ncbi:MAG: EamA family transporter, partial [Candidatus Rokuibacteriota bacterium]